MKIKRSERGRCKLRTSASLQEDHKTLFTLFTILKMLNAIIMPLRRKCLTYQLIRYLPYFFLQIKILLKVAPNSAFDFTNGEGIGVRF